MHETEWIEFKRKPILLKYGYPKFKNKTICDIVMYIPV